MPPSSLNSNLAESQGRCSIVDWQHSSDQIFIAAKISRILLLKLSFSFKRSGQTKPAPYLLHINYPPPGKPKSIEIGFSSHSVTIFELPKHEDIYATHNNKSTMKQAIHEMIPVLNKVIPLRSISFKIYCCFIAKTLKCFIQGSNLADS